MTTSAQSKVVQLQDRDIAVLRGLFESRVLTVRQAAMLYFDGSLAAAQKRLGKLKAAGLIGERPRRTYDPSVLFLTRRAFHALCDGEHILDYPQLSWANFEKRARVSPLTLRHEIEVMDAKAALIAAARSQAGLSLSQFSTWPVLFEFLASPSRGQPDVLVRPDGFIHIVDSTAGDPSEHFFFLELDRSSEPQTRLAPQASCYLDFYRRGGLAERFGHGKSEYKNFPFRVLILLKNAERRNNTAERMLLCNPPIYSQVWLTTHAEFLREPFSTIWIRPMDFRDAVAGTAYDVKARRANEIYRRQIERERHVESVIRKHALLPS